MGTETFTFNNDDYTETATHLKKMRQCIEDIVRLYRATQGIPDQFAPQWSGDVREHLKRTMEDYSIEARTLQIAAEKLLDEALAFIQKMQQGHNDLMRNLKGIIS